MKCTVYIIFNEVYIYGEQYFVFELYVKKILSAMDDSFKKGYRNKM